MELQETTIKEPRIDSFPSKPNLHLKNVDAKKEQVELPKLKETKTKESEEKLTKEKAAKEQEKVKEEKPESFKNQSTRLQFTFDKARNKTVISVLDGETGEVIRQIPPEEMMNSIPGKTSKVGFFVDQKI